VIVAVPLPDPPPQAKVAVIHWTSFYRHPFRLYVTHSAYRRLR
jgi:hypothetical protein